MSIVPVFPSSTTFVAIRLKLNMPGHLVSKVTAAAVWHYAGRFVIAFPHFGFFALWLHQRHNNGSTLERKKIDKNNF